MTTKQAFHKRLRELGMRKNSPKNPRCETVNVESRDFNNGDSVFILIDSWCGDLIVKRAAFVPAEWTLSETIDMFYVTK